MFDLVNKFNVNQTKLDDFSTKYLKGLTGASTLHHKGEGHQNGNMRKCKTIREKTANFMYLKY